MTEMWTTTQVAEHLGIELSGVHAQLHRWGIKPTARQPGRSGMNLYDADEVRAAHATRPGQGARTDLRETERARDDTKDQPPG